MVRRVSHLHFRLPIFDYPLIFSLQTIDLSWTLIGTPQLAIANASAHPLPRGGTDLIGTVQSCRAGDF